MNKKILIVEDEILLLGILRDQFSAEGFKVLEAQNGEEGLIAANKETPDIMLVDVLMPKMDGITMLQEARKNPKLTNVPVVILTNLNDAKTIEKALESGAYDFLVKSDWDPKDLVKHVKQKLGTT